MNTSKYSTIVRSALCAMLIALALNAAPASAWQDYTYDFSIKAPGNWIVLPNASVPGRFRYGWTSPEWATKDNTHGASIAVFVQPDTEGNSAKQLLEKNVSVINGVKFGNTPEQQIKVDKRAALKVVKQQLITVEGKQGFIMEVVGNGTGFAIAIPTDANVKQDKTAFKMMPTRQRWFCVLKGKMLVGVLSTCPDNMYARYAATFAATEKTLKIR